MAIIVRFCWFGNPSASHFSASQTSPGDDVFYWRREDLPSGSVTALIGVYGTDASNFTLLAKSAINGNGTHPIFKLAKDTDRSSTWP